MDAPKVELAKTELDFLHRLLLDLQCRLGEDDWARPEDEQAIAALELALALLQWDGATPPEFDAQVGLGAAVQLRLGADAMCAYRQWRNERRRQPGIVTP
jgi:hypothetical protein